MSRPRPIDPARLTLFASALTSVAEEMGAALVRSARSPNIKERRDCSCAVFDPGGSLVAQAAHVPVHLGAMPRSIRAALSAFPLLHPGDAVLLNDPFAGGTHLPDLTIATPVFAGRRRLALLASRAHHADVGGMSPGSLPMSRDIYQEGLRLPPVLLRRRGHVNEAVLAVLQANSRTPSERLGDIRAQLAAHDIGAVRLGELARHHGVGGLRTAMDDLHAYGRRRMESVIAAIPDGRYHATDCLDDDGHGTAPLPIAVTLSVRGRAVDIDFTGTAAACPGNLNAVEAITASAVYYCFLGLMVSTAGAGNDTPPINSGCFEPLRIAAPLGSLVNAAAPHAVVCGNLETSQRLVDVVLAALAQAVPDLIPAASQGTMNNLALGGHDATGTAFAYYETLAGGQGGGPGAPGMDAVQAHMTNTLNTPIEALEFSYPFRIERYEVLPRSGGRGRYRGGNGLRREIRILCPTTGTLLSDRRKTPPYGLHGGRPGRTGRQYLIRNGRVRRLASKVQLDLQPDDILGIETPGGGGWGVAGTDQ